MFSGKQTIKYSHTIPVCAPCLVTRVTEAGIMPSIEETGERDLGKKSELYLHSELKYLRECLQLLEIGLESWSFRQL